MDYHEFSFQGTKMLVPKDEPLKKIYLEPSSFCNLNCTMCFRHTWDEPYKHMDFSLFLNLIDSVEGMKELSTFHLGGLGEPFMHPRIFDMIEILKKRGYFLSISSNGTLLSSAKIQKIVDLGVDRLYLSLDPGVLGHGPLDPIIEKLKEIDIVRRESKKGKPMTGVEIVLTKDNIDYLPKLPDTLQDVGVTFIVLSNLIPTHKDIEKQVLYSKDRFENKNYDEFLKSTYSRFNVTLPEFEFKTERRCNFISNNATVIRSDGEVIPCYRFMYSYEEHYLNIDRKITVKSFGNLKKHSLFDIYNSREYAWFRFIVRNSLYPSCPDCNLRESCDFILETEKDCWGNEPSCSDCLWSRRIVICP